MDDPGSGAVMPLMSDGMTANKPDGYHDTLRQFQFIGMPGVDPHYPRQDRACWWTWRILMERTVEVWSA